MSSHLDFCAGSMIETLDLDDRSLMGLMGGEMRSNVARQYPRFGREDAQSMRSKAAEVSLSLLCRCDDAYPPALAGIRGAPAVIHVAGGLERFLALCEADPVAVVGSRKASEYGLEVARALGRGVSASGLTVVSGMALGIDSSAHEGALLGGARTVAVLPGCAAVAYPRTRRELHRRIVERSVAISELGPGTGIRRWMFPARNRIIAGLTQLVVVVQATDGSGALLTVEAARGYGRAVGAIPGSVLSRLSEGPNSLIAGGAWLIRNAQDVLDVIFGEGARDSSARDDAALTQEQQRVVDAILAGADSIAELARAGLGGEDGLAVIAALELAGTLRRGAGGRLAVTR